MELNEEVKHIRNQLGFSQRALGMAIGKDGKSARNHISDIELGRKKLSAEDYLKIKRLASKQ